MPTYSYSCEGCPREVELLPMLKFSVMNPDQVVPIEFVCADCGYVLGRLARCPNCNAVILINLTAKGTTGSPFCIIHGDLSMAGAQMREI